MTDRTLLDRDPFGNCLRCSNPPSGCLCLSPQLHHAEHQRLLQLMVRVPEDYEPWGGVVRWADPSQPYPDCSGGCRFNRPLEGALAADWGVCTNPASHRCNLLTFEHQGCQKFEPWEDEAE